jgi:hypothetical protein
MYILKKKSQIINNTRKKIEINFDVTDEDCKNLSKNVVLTHLDLYECRTITDMGYRYLSKLKTLSHLRIDSPTKTTNEGYKNLSKSKTIIRLIFWLNGKDILQICKYLMKSKSLLYLEFYFINVTSEIYQQLTRFKTLLCLKITQNDAFPRCHVYVKRGNNMFRKYVKKKFFS